MNNLNLIIGEDKTLIDYYLGSILAKIDYQDDNKISYDMQIARMSDILDEASMISLFATVKVIIGNNFDLDKVDDNDYEYLVKYTENVNSDVYIILLAKKVDARVKKFKIFKDKFKVIDIAKSNNRDNLLTYIENRVSNCNYKIDSYDSEYFLEKVGSDINNIDNELDKLFIYNSESKVIERNSIDLLVVDNIDNVIYEFTGAVIEKNSDKITKMYQDFKKENITPDYLIAALANSFRQALIIKSLNNDHKSNLEIAKVIGKKEYYVKKMLERLTYYTTDELGDMLVRLAKVDNDLKSGKSHIDSLEMFLLSLGN